VAVVAGVLIVGLVYALRSPQNDGAQAEVLVGEWRAQDTTNDALHRRDGGVQRERLLVRPDGTLSYLVEEMESGEGATTQPTLDRTEWGWKVEDGRLFVRDIGEGSTQEWFGSLKFDVDHETLTILRKKYPPKRFVREQYTRAGHPSSQEP
jgi:hypothetical protein